MIKGTWAIINNGAVFTSANNVTTFYTRSQLEEALKFTRSHPDSYITEASYEADLAHLQAGLELLLASQKTGAPKFCCNCDHYLAATEKAGAYLSARCLRDATKRYHLVTGVVSYENAKDCVTERYHEHGEGDFTDRCGKAGKYFRQKTNAEGDLKTYPLSAYENLANLGLSPKDYD